MPIVDRSAERIADLEGKLEAIDYYFETQQKIALEERIADLERQLAAKQAEIDRLMLEYCPDEMTQEQKETWAIHQKPYPSPEGDTP